MYLRRCSFHNTVNKLVHMMFKRGHATRPTVLDKKVKLVAGGRHTVNCNSSHPCDISCQENSLELVKKEGVPTTAK